MENKPTITYSYSESGDENLFLTLSTHLRSVLLEHPVTWERSYGRTHKKITLDSKLLPLTTALLQRTDLVTRPYFHIFWTNCNDSDYYRSTVKDEISSWLNEINTHTGNDWLIILVSGDGVSRTNKPKLQLTRSSMSDKLKTDFCSKQPERIQTLQDPLKDTSKAAESWSALCNKLVSLAILCIERAVSAYEEKVRAERERRNELSWNFCTYFTLQEELAFMFEMLHLYEEALIQYDELDAMFTQYVINAQAGDVAHWLSDFSLPITQWHPLSLWRRVDGEARQCIVQGKATIINIRNYLFSRHCHLLVKCDMLRKVTERMYTFLHSLETEIEILEISIPSGAVECWLFMSCLELSQTLKRHSSSHLGTKEDEAVMATPMSHDELALEMANLWDLARKKLFKLGKMCGLLPNQETTSEHLNHVVDLIAGIGDDEDRGGKIKPPALILRECLSSKTNFYRQYLELSEQAIGTYKHTGRFRIARSVGGDLAQFYMLSDKPEKAEPFMVDSVRMYTNEGWELLASKASENLAGCCKQLCKARRYIRLCCSLMCDKFLTKEKQKYYLEEVKNNSTDLGPMPVAVLLSAFASVKTVRFEPAQTNFHLNDAQHIYISINSIAPAKIKFHSLQISLRRMNIQSNEPHAGHAVNSFKLEDLDEDIFAEEESTDKEKIEVTSFFSSSLEHKSLDIPKRSATKQRYISSCSFDNIATIHQINKLDADGKIELLSMDNSLSQSPECKLKQFPSNINLSQESEIEVDNTIMWSSIICRQAHQLLSRQDSYQSIRSLHSGTTNIVMDSYMECLEAKDVTIYPGENIVKVKVNTLSPGEFSLTQMRLSINKVHFVLPRILPNISYIVSKNLPAVEIAEKSLTCGILDTAEIAINIGDYKVDSIENVLKLTTSLPLKIDKIIECTIKDNSEDVTISENLEVSCDQGDTSNTWSLILPTCKVQATLNLKVKCKHEIPEIQNDKDRKIHRRTHSAPLIRVQDFAEKKIQEPTSQKKEVLFPSTPLSLPHIPSLDKESPVKKFLSFMREVAGDKKEEPAEKFPTSTPSIQVNDDMIEVTLDDEEHDKVETFPQQAKRKLTRPFGFIGHRKTRSDVTAINFHRDTGSEESSSVKSVSSNNSSASIVQVNNKKSPLITFPRTPPSIAKHDDKKEKQVVEEDKFIVAPIAFEFPWGDVPKVSMDLKFLWPVEFNYTIHYCYIPGANITNHRILVLTLKNLSKHTLLFRNPGLKITNANHIFIKNLNFTDEFEVDEGQTLTYSWKITSGVEVRSSVHLNAKFSAELTTPGDLNWNPINYKFQFENVKTLYVIHTSIGKDEKIVCGQTTTLEITVERLRTDPEHDKTFNSYQMLMFKVVDTRGHWAVCERSSGLMSMPPAHTAEEGQTVTTKTSLEIMPLVDGYLHRPNVNIHRYYKRNSSEYDEQLSSTDSPVLKPPRLKDFRNGEVIYMDRARQVTVEKTSSSSPNKEFTEVPSKREILAPV